MYPNTPTASDPPIVIMYGVKPLSFLQKNTTTFEMILAKNAVLIQLCEGTYCNAC